MAMKQAARAESVGMAQIAQTARKLAPSVPFAKDSVGNPTIRSLVIIGRRVVFIGVAQFTSSRKKTTHPRTILNRQFDVRSRCQLRRYSEHRGIEILTGVNATSLTRDDTERLAGRRLLADQPVDIYAAGDVAEHDGSTSCVGVVAAEQGEIAAFNALGGRRRCGRHMRSTLL